MVHRGEHRKVAVLIAVVGLLLAASATAQAVPGNGWGNTEHGKDGAHGQLKKVEGTGTEEVVTQVDAEDITLPNGKPRKNPNPDCKAGPLRACGEEDGDHNQGGVCDGNNGLRPKSEVDCFGEPGDGPPSGTGITLEKSGPATAHVGDVITYTFEVTNTGQAAITQGELSDEMLGLTESFHPLTPNSHTPKNSVAFSATFTVPATAGDELVNTAEACGKSQGKTICDTDSHAVLILKPGVEVVKTASPESVSVGGTVTYTYVVTNTGNTALTGMKVSDDKLGDVGTVDSLAAGASQTFTMDVTVAADSPTENTATACGVDALGLEVCGSDTATIQISPAGASVLASVAVAQGKLPTTGTNLLLYIAAALNLTAAGLAMRMFRRRWMG